MCSFGRPRGVYTTNTANPVALQYYGNGIAMRSVLPARSAVAMGTPHPDHVYAAGLALPGDSGSRVMTADGWRSASSSPPVSTASGTHPAPSTPQPPARRATSAQGITRLGRQLARASEQLGVPLELVTAA
jgi:hypothetical protein